MTKDKIKAVTGGARQGSFGAPSLNDKGEVAYACVLYGSSIGAESLYSVVVRRQGKRPAEVVVQGGTPAVEYPNDTRTISDEILPPPRASNIYPVSGSGFMFKITRSVAINNKRQVGFAGELIFTMRTDNFQNGELVSYSVTRERRSVFGEAVRTGNTYRNISVATYVSYFDSILDKTLSINKAGSVPYQGTFYPTPDEGYPGFAYQGPKGGRVVATTASPVIGLDYKTTFVNFSEPVISNQNRSFLVATISEDSRDWDGIWEGNNPRLNPVVIRDTSAPGGGTYESFGGRIGPSQNAKLVAYVGNLTGLENVRRGIFRASSKGKNQIRIAAVGDKVPGTTSTFSDFDFAAVSNRGHVAILGKFQDTNGKDRQGIWLTDKDGKNLRPIIVQGQKFTIGNKSVVVRAIAFNPVSGLNNKGQVAYTATFSDKSSAVIISNY